MSADIAVVTGASRGIGRAIALKLAEQGADVVGVARDRSGLESLSREVADLGTRFMPLPFDLTEPDAPGQVVQRSWDWQGKITTLVNAAGILIRKQEEDITDNDWIATFVLNVRVPQLLMWEFGGRMNGGDGGVIVNVASMAGERVTGAPPHYQASKAALIQLTRYYAERLAPNVRVNAVGPGYVRTELSREWLAVRENEQWVEDRTPMRRVATPEEIAGPVAFLASKEAAYITGHHLLVDGGWSVR